MTAPQRGHGGKATDVEVSPAGVVRAGGGPRLHGASCDVRHLPGDHFFLHTYERRYLQELSTGLAAIAPHHGCAATEPWPTHGWRVGTPESQGVDSARLAEAVALTHLLPRDMAKIGYLYLRHGKWNDRQIPIARAKTRRLIAPTAGGPCGELGILGSFGIELRSRAGELLAGASRSALLAAIR